MITYNLAPNPLWVLRDNSGEPLANGTMKAFRNTVRSEYKPVYKNMAGTVAWSQPIVFNAAGFQGEFYWASDENYYLEIYDSNGNLVRTVSDFNAPNDGGSTPVNVNVDFVNYVNDPQFNYMTSLNYSPLATTNLLGVSNWFFDKNNTSATDEINIVEFTPGSATPPYNPRYYLSYECTVAGTGETVKDLYYHWRDVYSWQNAEITVQLYGQSPTVATDVEVLFLQYFGTGGTPSASVYTSVTTFTLTNTWDLYQAIITVPTITGKTLGTNNDSYVAVVFRFQQNTITTIQLTNIQVNDGNDYQPFGYLPATNEATLQLPRFNSLDTTFAIPFINEDKELAWTSRANPIEGEAALTSIGLVAGVLPITQTAGTLTWITSDQFKPTFPCLAFFNAYCYVESDGGAKEVQVYAKLNGSTMIASQSVSFDATTAVSAEVMLPVLMSYNGTTDYIEIEALFSGTGTAGVQINFIYASNITNYV